MPRKLRVEYRSEDSFRREHAQNISKGGIFIPTRHQLEIRENVEIELVLAFRDQSIVLPGEVVHCIAPEMAATGAQPGVAIQFLVGGDELRSKLELFAGALGPPSDERVQGTGRRVAPRSRARVSARVDVDGEWLDGHTRNISSSGVLIALSGSPPPIGKNVSVGICHPAGEEEILIPGRVARHVEASGTTCIGIQFRIPEARCDEVTEFVSSLRAIEHSRKLGGINGPIADLGIRSLLTMFGTTAPEGMLTLTHGVEEGYITIDHGQLRAQLGNAMGAEALDAMLSWADGSFEFEAQPDDGLVNGPQIPVSQVAEGAASGPAPSLAPEPEPPLPELEQGEQEVRGAELSLVNLDELDLDDDLAQPQEVDEPDYDDVELDMEIDDDELDELDLEAEGFGEAPADLGEAPADLEEAPAALGEAPAALGEAPAALGEAPADLEEAPAALKKEPEAFDSSRADPEPVDEAFQLDDDAGLGDFLFEDEDLEAPVQGLDSLGVDVSPISPDDSLCPTGEGDRSDLSKIEEALLDLAEVGMTVCKAVDVIPESDEEIYAAVRSLLDEGLLTLR